MTMVLGVLFLLIRLALAARGKVMGEAATFAELLPRYHQGLRPVDLIHIGDFIQAWVPPAH